MHSYELIAELLTLTCRRLAVDSYCRYQYIIYNCEAALACRPATVARLDTCIMQYHNFFKENAAFVYISRIQNFLGVEECKA
jgi:hypothetical protein